jgi:chitodextrinase
LDLVLGAIEAVGQFLAQLSGIGVSAVANQGLEDTVSGDLSILYSYNANTAAIDAGQQFTSLFDTLKQASSAGFTQFAVTAGDNESLIFRLTYPQPPAPVLVDPRKGIFATPSISVNPTSVIAGQSLTLSGEYFKPVFVNSAVVDWNQTVAGPPQGTVSYLIPPLSRPHTATVTGLSFQLTGLSPSTNYVFQVQECDQITCTPLSSTLVLTTDPAGSNQVAFSLDKTSNTFGSALTLPAGGSFSVPEVIPAGTAPGLHTLYATAGIQQASASVDVCAATGCGPTLEMLGSNGVPDAPGALTNPGSPITLAGFNFDAGQTVTFTVDSSSGTKIGSTTVSSIGRFQGTYTMPYVPYGAHTVVAASAGATAKFSVTVPSPAQ